NQLKNLLVTAPAPLRESITGTTTQLVATCARLRPGTHLSDPSTATKTALRVLARRYQHLSEEITGFDKQLAALTKTTAPELVAIHGVGPETAAQLLITAGDNPDRLRGEAAFAHLCGTAPIPASSGQTRRQRLNRGGDRQANRALYTIALTRLATCPRTKAYRDRRREQGLTNKEIIRCLKRYIAREIHHALTVDKP
ncbi:transposase, partial [Luedemannella helvata]|uniref:transposase n=1 Tax=Luedemannella helvata TaxID=349315 RepID=UPI0031DDAA16